MSAQTNTEKLNIEICALKEETTTQRLHGHIFVPDHILV